MKIIINSFSIVFILLFLILGLKTSVMAHVPLDTSAPASKEDPIFVEKVNSTYLILTLLTAAETFVLYKFIS
ncbi:MAG: hypothetical protein ACOC2I_02415 [Halanaerobium sp.]